MRQHLTEIGVRALKPTGKQFRVWDTATPGFGVLVNGRSKSWIVMYGTDRKLKVLGHFPATSLADARKRAKGFLLDPKTEPASLTFSEAAEAFLRAQDHLSERSKTDYAWHLKRHFEPPLGRKPLNEIDTHHVLKILDDLQDKPALRKYAHSVVRRLFRWAVGRRYIKHSPIQGADVPKPVPSRDRVLTDDELRAIWKATDEPTTYNRIVRMLLLTGQRAGEITALQTSWIKDNEIVFPKEATKNGREHPCPLAPSSLTLIQTSSLSNGTETYLFPARGSGTHPKPFNGFSKSKLALDKKLGPDFKPWTLHDLRRTFATNMARLGVPIHVVEKLLNHLSGSFGGIVGVYQRHSYAAEMRDAVERYEKWFITLQSS
jgi:integrase